jgi:intracellular sulfur oxidation DsrE/DsrF family protein
MKAFIVTVFLCLLNWSGLLHADTPKPSMGPVIENFGPYLPVPEPGFATPMDQSLKAVFDVASSPEPGEASRYLETPARFLNMHAGSGVPEENLRVAVVIHGKATRELLTDVAFQKRFGMDNPNRALVEALIAADVEIVLCGQSAAFGGYDKSELLPGVKLALSAMTALVSLQNQGYRLIAF